MKLFKRIQAIFIFLKHSAILKKLSKDIDYINSAHGKKATHNFLTTYFKAAIALSPYDFEIIGAEKLKGLQKSIIMANHKSNFDPFVIQAFLPFSAGWFAKESLFKNRFFSHIVISSRSFGIDRGNIKQTSVQFLKAAREFKQGRNLAFFPEGTRSKTEDMLSFKEPIFAFSKKLKADIVPIKLDYRKSLKNIDGSKNKKFIIKILDIVKFEDVENLTPKKLKEKIFNLINKA